MRWVFAHGFGSILCKTAIFRFTKMGANEKEQCLTHWNFKTITSFTNSFCFLGVSHFLRVWVQFAKGAYELNTGPALIFLGFQTLTGVELIKQTTVCSFQSVFASILEITFSFLKFLFFLVKSYLFEVFYFLKNTLKILLFSAFENHKKNNFSFFILYHYSFANSKAFAQRVYNNQGCATGRAEAGRAGPGRAGPGFLRVPGQKNKKSVFGNILVF